MIHKVKHLQKLLRFVNQYANFAIVALRLYILDLTILQEISQIKPVDELDEAPQSLSPAHNSSDDEEDFLNQENKLILIFQ